MRFSGFLVLVFIISLLFPTQVNSAASVFKQAVFTNASPIDTAKASKKVTNKKQLPTYFFYFTTWCPYCEKMAPEILKASEKYKDKVFFYYVNMETDEGKKIAATYKNKVQGIPHSQFYDKDGNLVDEQLGYINLAQIEAKIKKNFGL